MAPIEGQGRRAVLATGLSAVGVLLSVRGLGATQGVATGVTGRRPRSFWTAIVESEYAVPLGQAPVDLLLELGRHFGDPDPVLRDRCGYGITARWVVREKRLSNADLQRLATAWLPGLRAGAVPEGGDAVLYRSFSALGLSLVVAADLGQHALDASTVSALVDLGSHQLRTNTDRRGFEPGLGWVHVTAHTADLLKFLGRHPLLTTAHQRLLLDAVAITVTSAPTVFQWGEDERLSRAAASVLRRDDADPRVIDGFLDTLQQVGSRVDWDQPLANGGVGPALNAKAVLKDLHLVLSVAGKDERRQQVLRRLEALP
ncbi:hypothetical protein TBR22_A32580 [Luteitalea sp. TBR-22]|uniref:DUF2785 domain-containing protein n=1 Tax=Luteitalea sp. TBR-22 TaxID=2802971 RepID=UPI001AF12255|nr:DUF2785 domain-containing protein [Luteitalea sp. TBR-22]BCS34029.1 hypothetical protein TBR22_A32580 [Luteitalea sp. TBR-22]